MSKTKRTKTPPELKAKAAAKRAAAVASSVEPTAKTSVRKRVAATRSRKAAVAPAPANGGTTLPATSASVAEVPEMKVQKPQLPGISLPAGVTKPLPPVPSILLEGDQPATPLPTGPGRRYALGPTAPVATADSGGELPEAYGTQQVLLVARDPHWLYAHWDLTTEQQRRYNALSLDRHMVVRVYLDSLNGPRVAEVHVHPESRYWFIHVDRAGVKYVCELGYYGKDERWRMVSTSSATITPPETISDDSSVEFATVPLEVPLSRLVALVEEAARQNLPLARAIEELRENGHPELPAMSTSTPPAPWTAAQEQALADVLSMDKVRRVWMGSLEITELIRGQFQRELASQSASQIAGYQLEALPKYSPPPAEWSAISSPAGGEQPGQNPPGFWLNVNAELIVYGATDPTATVTISDRPIKLRQDGSFSYRFALPDGNYELAVVAVSADKTDGRAADMRFARVTQFLGDVGVSPQEPGLKAPDPDNV